MPAEFRELGDIYNTLKEDDAYYESLLSDELVISLIKSGYENKDDLSEWCWYNDPTILKMVCEKFKTEIGTQIEKFDIIATCGASGCPIASYLSLEFGKKFLLVNDRWGITKEFQPIKPQSYHQNEKGDNLEGKKILLIDSVLKTGYTLYNAVNALKENNVGSINLLMIALLPRWKDSEIFEELERYETYFLFRWDEEICAKARSRGIINVDSIDSTT